MAQPPNMNGYKCVRPKVDNEDTPDIHWLTQNEDCYQKCNFHGGKCENVCGTDGYCCKSASLGDPEADNQDCPPIAIFSIPATQSKHVCVKQGKLNIVEK